MSFNLKILVVCDDCCFTVTYNFNVCTLQNAIISGAHAGAQLVAVETLTIDPRILLSPTLDNTTSSLSP